MAEAETGTPYRRRCIEEPVSGAMYRKTRSGGLARRQPSVCPPMSAERMPPMSAERMPSRARETTGPAHVVILTTGKNSPAKPSVPQGDLFRTGWGDSRSSMRSSYRGIRNRPSLPVAVDSCADPGRRRTTRRRRHPNPSLFRHPERSEGSPAKPMRASQEANLDSVTSHCFKLAKSN
jgi:hypothetical protein